MLLDQVKGRYKAKVIPPSKRHGSNDEKEKETNIGYETQRKSVNYLYLSLVVPLLFLAVKSKNKIIEFPPSRQEASFFEKVTLGDEGPEISHVWHRAQG